MANRKLFIGVDGGGTKTGAVLMDAEGTIVAERLGGSTNPHSNSRYEVGDTLRSLFEGLHADSRTEAADVSCACLALAGCDREADRKLIEAIAAPLLAAGTKLLIVNDAIGAMIACLGRLDGILVIAGTGSICLGVNGATGEQARCGGWGHVLADEGGGYQIGREALMAVLHEFDGRGPATALTSAILGALALAQPTDVISWMLKNDYSKSAIADLARHVHAADGEGDAVAGAILDRQARLLFETVPPVFRKLWGAGGDGVRVGLWGGNLVKAARYRKRFEERVAHSGMPLETVLSDANAAVGAARHALASVR